MMKELIITFLLLLISGSILAKDKEEKEKIDLRKEIAMIGNELNARESNIKALHNEYIAPSIGTQLYTIDKRLIDADVFFETNQYDKAATLYRELIDTPQFKSHSDYYKVIYKLGLSLMKEKNYIAASNTFRKILTPQSGEYRYKALACIFETSLNLRDKSFVTEFEDYVKNQTPSSMSDEMLYAYGKYLNSKDDNRALELFQNIPKSSSYYIKSRYYMAVVYTKMGKINEAILNFSEVSGSQIPKENQSIKDIANLNLGRLFFETGDFDNAMASFQKVEKSSSEFNEALYGISWIFIRKEEYSKALQNLEILILGRPDNQLLLQARIDRANILTKTKDYTGAMDNFEALIKELQPVRNELNEMGKNPENILNYFKSFLARKGEKYDVHVTENTTKWLKTNNEMKSIFEALNDLSAEKTNISEAMDIVQRLKWALQSNNRIDVFPPLKDGWLKIQENENLLISLAMKNAALLRYLLFPKFNEEENQSYKKILNEREALESLFRKLPKTFQAFKTREKAVSDEFFTMQKRLFQVESVVQLMKEQVISVEEWFKEEDFKGGLKDYSEEQKSAFRAQIEEEKTLMKDLMKQVENLRSEIDKEMLTAGATGIFEGSEDKVRKDLLENLWAEEKIFRNAGIRLSGEQKKYADTLLGYQERIRNLIYEVDPIRTKLSTLVDKNADEFMKAVEKEENNLNGYSTDLTVTETNAVNFSKTVGLELFEQIRATIDDTVIEADVGIIDVAWARKQEKTEEKETIAREQGEETKKVDESLKVITEGSRFKTEEASKEKKKPAEGEEP
jgi:tetratricopeptide (TPR) repeat protein